MDTHCYSRGGGEWYTSLKGAAKEGAMTVLMTLLLNPIVLIVLFVLGIIVVVASLAIIIYYGLMTAIVFFLFALMGLLFLEFIGVDLSKEPLIASTLVVMPLIGYILQRANILSIMPLWTVPTATSTAGNLIIIFVIIFIAIIAIAARKGKRH